MPHLRQAAPDILSTARARRSDPAEVARLLLIEKAAGRDSYGDCVLRNPRCVCARGSAAPSGSARASCPAIGIPGRIDKAAPRRSTCPVAIAEERYVVAFA